MAWWNDWGGFRPTSTKKKLKLLFLLAFGNGGVTSDDMNPVQQAVELIREQQVLNSRIKAFLVSQGELSFSEVFGLKLWVAEKLAELPPATSTATKTDDETNR